VIDDGVDEIAGRPARRLGGGFLGHEALIGDYLAGFTPEFLGNAKVFAGPPPIVKVRFAEFTLDSDTRLLLRRGGDEIRLSPKAFDLLCLLVERRPAVIEKSELHAHIWPATFVVEANLNVLIAEIRRALGDDAKQSRFVRTAHGVGYAFAAETVELDRPAGRSPGAGSARFWLLWNERTLVLNEGENIVGRDPQCDVWLDASGVSRRHARIQVTSGEGAVLLEDLGSKNGTLLQNEPIAGPARLVDGDVIQIGSVELKLRVWSENKGAETERIARHQ
jgi:DNA-binding winged helix-turn-helix (wHTH) protein